LAALAGGAAPCQPAARHRLQRYHSRRAPCPLLFSDCRLLLLLLRRAAVGNLCCADG
jgi:hypothetical protein